MLLEHFHRQLALLFYVLCVLTACGGSSRTSDGSEPFRQNVFEPSTQFKSRCEVPRTGIDPATSRAFVDVQGSTLDENNWLRSWSNETYLWYDEIIDQDPAGFTDTADYFEVLKTNLTTSSGTPKDKFHYIVPTDEWFSLSQLGVSASYGAEFAIMGTNPSREILVAFVEPGSPADIAGLSRGTSIVEVDGVVVASAQFSSEFDILNNGLFPALAGENHQFLVRPVGSAISNSVTLQSAQLTTTSVLTSSVINTPSGIAGYIVFNDHLANSELQIVNAFTAMQQANVDELILDLRYNGGGFLGIAAQVGYMVAGNTSLNQTFELTSFNDKHQTVDPVSGRLITPIPFVDETLGLSTTAGQQLPALNLNRLFVLTSGDTCSASESIINGLRGIDIDVIQIGTGTCGKPYGFYPTDNCGSTYFSVQFRGENAKGFGDYSDGFAPINSPTNIGEQLPGCYVADDFTKQLGDTSEALLAEALAYIENGSCSAALAGSQKVLVPAEAAELIRPNYREQRFLHQLP